MAANDLSYTNSLSTTLNLNDGTTYRLEDYPKGIFGFDHDLLSAPIPTFLPVAVHQGYNPKERVIEVPLQVHGTGFSALTTNLAALFAEFWPDIRGQGRGTLTYTAWNNVARAIKVAPGKMDIDEWLKTVSSAKGMLRVKLPFTAVEPTFYDATPVTPSGAFNNSTPVAISCANTGDCDAYPTITYTQAAGSTTVNPQVTDAYGQVFKIENTMAASSSLVISLDPQALSVIYTVGGVAYNWFGYRSAASQVPVCKYGTNNLTFVATSGTASIGISFNSRYSRHGA